MIKSLYCLIFPRKHALNALNLTSTQSFSHFGFQLHTLGAVEL